MSKMSNMTSDFQSMFQINWKKQHVCTFYKLPTYRVKATNFREEGVPHKTVAYLILYF